LEAETAVHEPVKVKAELVSSTVVFVMAPFTEGAQSKSRKIANISRCRNECGDPMSGACRQAENHCGCKGQESSLVRESASMEGRRTKWIKCVANQRLSAATSFFEIAIFRIFRGSCLATKSSFAQIHRIRKNYLPEERATMRNSPNIHRKQKL
jgi:hypothetical protein